MSDVTIQLSSAIQVEGESVMELTLREPTVKDLRAIDKVVGDMEQNIDLVSRLASVPKSSLDALTARDYTRLQKVLMDFLVPGRADGESN